MCPLSVAGRAMADPIMPEPMMTMFFEEVLMICLVSLWYCFEMGNIAFW